MNWKFWKRSVKKPLVCDHIRVKSNPVGHYDKAWLEDGHFTSFMLLHCTRCGRLTGFPASNFQMALDRGTPETKQALEILRPKVEGAKP
jgi:hypothetical protein